ncbi:ABC1 kinase family protein [Bacillus sp. T33-2]|uniref:ABC1 kinase family protein n=1 Tax=Bacillus sp. T33-2 TaxID=2054168 RepID=UPI000C77DBC9|nr:AarF/UbiB family protein [Bacillus sp. T33-2]PLR98469.1 ABC transporter [Bacillus sp. T33-2]
MKKEKRWYRMWKIISLALSIFSKAYWFKIRKKPDREWDRLWEMIGRDFRETLFELEGLLIKVGQLLSIRADLLPNGFIKQIQDLVDQVPPSPWNDIKQVLEQEWDGPIEDTLLSIEKVPIASASIGEVYRARLLDGTEAAVKVQRPTIKSIIHTDFRALEIVIWFAKHFAPVPKGFINFDMLFKELKLVIERELDFKKEMDTMNRFRQRFSSFKRLAIPQTYPGLCTSQILVMEWISAARVTDTEFLDQHHVDRKELSRFLFRVFLPQWLEPGFFHADPHTGNVLVKSDGTLVLLDFGMVGEISKKDASNFQNLVEALIVKDYSNAASILQDLGFLLPDVNPKSIEHHLKDALSINLDHLKEMDLFAVQKEMNDIVRSLPIQVPTRFIFLGRSFVTIEGMLNTICPNADMMAIAKDEFKEWLNNSPLNKWKLVMKWINSQPVFQIVHSIADLLDAPKRIMEHKDIQQQRDLYFTMYENKKKHSFYLGLLGITGAMYSNYVQDCLIWNGSIGLIAAALTGYVVVSWKQRSWLKLNK